MTPTQTEADAVGTPAIEVGGEQVVLTRHRAAWWPAERTVLVADLHLGKGEAFRAGGMPMAHTVLRGVLADTLRRLDAAVVATDAERVLVLGDLLHAPTGITDLMLEQVGDWRRRWPGAFELVPGNHDRQVERVADAWGMTILEPEVSVRGVVLRHHPMIDAGHAHICGHIHPAAELCDGAQSVRVPVYWRRGVSLVLPAFTRFAAGKVVRAEPGHAVYAIGPRRVTRIRSSTA